MSDDLRIFEEAFASGCCTCCMTCDCGRTYWDSYNTGYTWNEGEKDRLQNDPNATSLPHSVGIVEFEGRTCAADCTCWHARAERVMAFLFEHKGKIAEFFRLKRKSLHEAAESMPCMEVGHE